MVVAVARETQAKGGCPLGSLGGQLSESDPEPRALVAAGFEQWSIAISDGLRALQTDGQVPCDIGPDDLAVTLLATLQGGLLLAQTQRSARPFETAVDTLLALVLRGWAQGGLSCVRTLPTRRCHTLSCQCPSTRYWR
jgi:hypothetical protein